jgi:type IV pilus assembly protein PilO
MARSFHQYSPRAQAIVCAVLSAAAFGAAWQVLIAPERAAIVARRDRLTVLTADVTRATQAAQRLPIVQKQVAALEAELLVTTAVLPDEKDAQDVLRGLHVLASDANLSISSFTPKPVTDRTQYSEWPIEVGLEGGFHDLGRFFERVASESRLISVSNLHLKVNPGAAGGRRGLVLASCVATTFVFSPPAAGVRP